MKEYFGYAGTILEINLSSRKINKIPLDEKMARDFLGGVGISTKLLYERIDPAVDPYAPGNVWILGSGALGGTLAPTSGRTEVVSKSPMSGKIGWANTGWSVASMLKWAGYDQLVVTGTSDTPVYIWIENDEVEIRDASHLWGKDTYETTETLWRDLGKDCWITTIGPAAENLVRFASVISKKHSAAARTGMGSVLGSKKLKAIVVRGTKGIKVAKKKKFLSLVEEAINRFKERNPLVMEWRTYGFLAGFKEIVDIEQFLGLRGNYYACPACPVGCNSWVNIRSGKYAGLSYLSSAPGTKITYYIDIPPFDKQYDELYVLGELGNKYGVDMFALKAVIELANNLYDQGIVTKKDLGGQELRGNPEAIKEFLRKIVYREGIGDTFAEGVHKACAIFGKGAEKYDVSIKGVDSTGARGGLMGATETFGFATSNRGGWMERATSISFRPRKREAYVRYCAAIGVPQQAVDRVCDGPEGLNVPRLTRHVEDFLTLVPMQGLCRRPPVSQVYDIHLHSDFYSCATGFEVTGEDLLKCAERVWNLQKAFNILAGGSRKDDRFPGSLLPLKLGGKELNSDNMDEWLNEYYSERGWDIETGRPTKKKLESLNLDDVANDLEKQGLIG